MSVLSYSHAILQRCLNALSNEFSAKNILNCTATCYFEKHFYIKALSNAKKNNVME